MHFDEDNVPNCAGVVLHAEFPNMCEEDQDPNVSPLFCALCSSFSCLLAMCADR